VPQMQHLNFFCLHSLAQYLTSWTGSTVAEAFSQQKDELVLFLRSGRKRLYLRISCRPEFSFILPEYRFYRSKSNTVDLFPELIGLQLTKVEMLGLDRLLCFQLEQNWSIVAKMFGNRSNVIAFQHQVPHAIFRQNIADDLTFQWPANCQTDIPLEAIDAAQSIEAKQELLPIFDRSCWQHVQALCAKGYSTHDAVKAIIALAQDELFYILDTRTAVQFYLFHPANPLGAIDATAEKNNSPQESHITEIVGIVPALQQFIKLFFSRRQFRIAYQRIQDEVEHIAKKIQHRLRSAQKTLQKLETTRDPAEFGHLILANLHLISPRATVVIVQDFYNDNVDLEIELDAMLNPQQNAEAYYQKHKEWRFKWDRFEKELQLAQQEWEEHAPIVAAFEAVKDKKSLQQFEASYKQLLGQQSNQHSQLLPYRVYHFAGYQIWVGRNAKQNDKLTFGFAHKNDTWLHVKGGAGSHVVIRHQNRLQPPLAVLEHAAGLAAYFSKLRSNDLVPVAYTLRKYVRKPKPFVPGQVRLERETILLIEPRTPPEND
jgi:predicted ribosome quality control (RQC) complex YloA/Tae2 family protein